MVLGSSVDAELVVLAGFLVLLHRREAVERVTVNVDGATVHGDFAGAPSFRTLLTDLRRQAPSTPRNCQATVDGEPRTLDLRDQQPELAQLRTLLAAAEAAPDTPVDELPLDDPGQLAATRAAFNRIAEGPVERTVLDLIAEHHDQPAIDWAGSTTSYRELDELAAAYAAALPRDARGRAVAVRMRPGPAQIAALLAVLRAGAHLVWLGTGDGGERARWVLEDVAPVAVLTDTDQPASTPIGDNTAPVPVALTDRAYIAHTSGSTGRPKGVPHTHAALAQFASWLADEFRIGPGSRVAQWVAPEHDPALAEVFATLVSGAVLCPVPPEIRTNPDRLAPWLAEQRITVLQTVPSFARELLAAARNDDLLELDTVLLMGEALPTELVDALSKALPTARLANLYGPTETVAATYHVIDGPASGQVPIGLPIPGREVLIVDDADQVCPAGVTGEIVIRGPYVSSGYLGAQADNRAFTPIDDSGTRCYRTGDLARQRADGLLEFRGRRDFQVKVQGHRIELTEIEHLLAAHESIAECAVLPVADADGLVTRLTVYVVTADGAAPQPRVWRAALRHRFGGALLPVVFRTLPGRLPRTVAGKVDRARLPRTR